MPIEVVVLEYSVRDEVLMKLARKSLTASTHVRA